jgi:type VI protein secretion system component VasF
MAPPVLLLGYPKVLYHIISLGHQGKREKKKGLTQKFQQQIHQKVPARDGKKENQCCHEPEIH